MFVECGCCFTTNSFSGPAGFCVTAAAALAADKATASAFSPAALADSAAADALDAAATLGWTALVTGTTFFS